ncbi:hypothetical protein KR018_012087 [Drosophila ironensis]|nr:hypothetical protein KR018_012087 [Drosophila ironensis]
MAVRKSLALGGVVLVVLLLVADSHAQVQTQTQAKPVQDLTELSDLVAKNKTAVVVDSEADLDSSQESEEKLQPRQAYPHRDEDQLNSATNLVLARNYKYDVEILESGDESHSEESEELEERFKGRGVVFSTDSDTYAAENIEMTPVDVQADAVSEGHVLLGIVVVALALVSICLYAGLVIWRSHLEQRYGMRERLVNRDIEEEAGGEEYQVYAPTTTLAPPRA